MNSFHCFLNIYFVFAEQFNGLTGMGTLKNRIGQLMELKMAAEMLMLLDCLTFTKYYYLCLN